ncbi:TadE/TadG family type IV pilus assembly protein [Candidatus Poriferisodalis sp.]|uniref:TadE/TadG family type IV pilus assembly protein n=1 Tax=Candidatus Poriferisodalis sp. TaxID=3101277 RepID=UPI003B018722
MGNQHRQDRPPARRSLQLPDQGHLLSSRPRREQGQATVELALLLPFLVFLLMCIVQTALVARDAVLVSHAARVGARIAAVNPSMDAVRDAVASAAPLDPHRLDVERMVAGDLVRVTVRYRSATEVPLAGALVGDVHLSESAAMPDERSHGQRASAEIAACACHTHGVQWQVTHL